MTLGALIGYLELVDNFSAGLDKAVTKFNDASNSLEKVGRKITRTGMDLLPLSAGVAALGAASWKASKDFEEVSSRWVSLASVQKE